jgi:hypothetical protein
LESSSHSVNSRNSSFANNQPGQFVAKASPVDEMEISSASREQAFRNTFKSGEEQQAQALARLLPEWVSDDPQTAANFVKTMPVGLSRDKTLRVVVQVWGEHDPCGIARLGAGIER